MGLKIDMRLHLNLLCKTRWVRFFACIRQSFFNAFPLPAWSREVSAVIWWKLVDLSHIHQFTNDIHGVKFFDQTIGIGRWLSLRKTYIKHTHTDARTHHHRLMNARANNAESSAFRTMHSITSPNSYELGGVLRFFSRPLAEFKFTAMRKASTRALCIMANRHTHAAILNMQRTNVQIHFWKIENCTCREIERMSKRERESGRQSQRKTSGCNKSFAKNCVTLS